MKYEVPVCEIIEICVEDVITTSVPVSGAEKAPYGDTVIVDINSDTGSNGVEGN